MEIIGAYTCEKLNSELVIQDQEGTEARGFFAFENIRIPVNIHFSPNSDRGSGIDMRFSGNIDNPNLYIGGVGRADNLGFEQIEIAGGYPTTESVTTFQGTYIRQ